MRPRSRCQLPAAPSLLGVNGRGEAGSLGPDDLSSVAAVVVGNLRAAGDGEWSRPVAGLEWSCWDTADHLATVLLSFAAWVAGRTTGPTPKARRTDRDLQGPQLVELIASSAHLLGLALAELAPETRVFHPVAMADREGYVAMACDEILVHGAEIAATLQVPFRPPDAVAGRVAARLFPWAPTGFGGWETLLWANDRGDLAGHPRPGHSWVWHCAPLPEWDGFVPRWDPVGRRVIPHDEPRSRH